MCGRYASARTDAQIAQELKATVVDGDPTPPDWNIAPTREARVVVERSPIDHTDDQPAAAGHYERTLRTARWGLVPSWAKDLKIGQRLINARSETLTEKPAFRAAAARRRALVPADGYYEWEKGPTGAKTPYYLHREEQLLAFAGLYELWPDPQREQDDPLRWMWSYTIITRPAADSLGHIHDRSPVVLPPAQWASWLNPEMTDPDQVRDLLADIPDPDLVPRQVGSSVGNVRNNGPELITAVS